MCVDHLSTLSCRGKKFMIWYEDGAVMVFQNCFTWCLDNTTARWLIESCYCVLTNPSPTCRERGESTKDDVKPMIGGLVSTWANGNVYDLYGYELVWCGIEIVIIRGERTTSKQTNHSTISTISKGIHNQAKTKRYMIWIYPPPTWVYHQDNKDKSQQI